MATMIDTGKTAGRRQLRFNAIDDILADVEHLARSGQVRALGNWSSGQVVQHLAMVMNNSVNGFTTFPPLVVRVLLRLFMKRRFLTQTMSAGFKLPDRATDLLPPPIGFENAVANFRRAFDQLKSDSRRCPHPAIGPLSPKEWEQLHCRHSELHLSFLLPAKS